MQGIPRSRIAVSVRRRFRCAAVGCVCPPAVSRRSGNGVPAPVCVSPRRSSRSGSAQPMRSSAFAPPIFCERCAAAPNAGFLRLTQADGGMAFTGRFSDAERSLTAPPCLNARTAARFGIRRKRLGRISRAAPQQQGRAPQCRRPNAPPQRSAETFLLLPIRRCFARLPRRPALRVRRPVSLPARPLCRTPPSHMENPAFSRILIKITRISRSAAGTSDGKRESVLIPRKPPPLAVFVCRGYNDMRQKNQTRRAEDAGDKAARTCRKADAALSAVHREAQARLYRQQWHSLKRGAVKAEVRCGTDCRYIHRRRKRCEGDAAIAGRPSAPSSQPPQHGA